MNSVSSYAELKEHLRTGDNVYCKDVPLSLDQIAEIIEIMKTNPNLKILVFWNNNVGDSGAVLFAEFLKTNTTLTDFGLGNNNVTEEGAISLAQALRENHTLTLLGLTQNKIGENGARALADSLKINKTLQFLKIGGNMIGDKGLKHIANGLKGSSKNDRNNSLTFLELDMNMITDEGAQDFAKALKKTETGLTRICLYDNKIGPKGATALKTLKNIKSGLFGNPVNTHPDPGQATLARLK